MLQALFLEAGHGRSIFSTKDSGAVGRYGEKVYLERDFAKDLAGRVLQILNGKEELKGVLIQGVGIETEASIVRKMAYVNTVIRENRFSPHKCLGVAIHMNAAMSPKARGFEAWHQKNNSKSVVLGREIVAAWEKYNLLPLRPKALVSSKFSRYGRFYIDDALCPYVIVEAGFISNFEDFYAIQKNAARAAEAIAHGVLNYVRNFK